MIERVCAPDAGHPPPTPPVALPPIGDTKGWRALWFGNPQRQGSLSATTGQAEAHCEPASTHATPGLGCVTTARLPPAETDVDHASDSEDEGEPPVKVHVCEDQPAKRVAVGVPAYVSILTALDHVSSLTLLERHVHRVCGCQNRVPFSYAQWMYGLLARLDLPLDPDTASNLRVLLKHCCRLRASRCVRGKDGGEDHRCHDGAHPDLPSLNVIISLLHRVFGQLE